MVSFTEDLLDDWGLAFKILIPVAYLVVLWEHFYSSESEYLKNLDDVSGIDEFLKTLRESLGHIMFHGKCYHWETRTRTVYETDSKGNSRTRYETYQEMVATHFDAETYEHARQVDVSPATIKDTTGASKSVTRVKLFKNYEFGDEQTAQDFHAKSEAFQKRNRDLIIAQDTALLFQKYSPYRLHKAENNRFVTNLEQICKLHQGKGCSFRFPDRLHHSLVRGTHNSYQGCLWGAVLVRKVLVPDGDVIGTKLALQVAVPGGHGEGGVYRHEEDICTLNKFIIQPLL